MISTTWTLNRGAFSPLLFTGLIDECLSVSKKLGVDGVELSIRGPGDIGVMEVSKKINDHDLAVSAVGTGLALLEDGLSFSNHNSIIRQAALNRFKEQIRFASQLNAPVILGLIHGNVSLNGDEHQNELDCIYEATRNAAKFASDLGVSIVVEPINRYETNFINTIDEALKFIETVNEPNLGMMIDTFHMNIEERALYDSIKKCEGVLMHVHLADSNRMVPGYGHIDFRRVLNELKSIRYDKYLSLECLPKPDPITASFDGVEFLCSIMN